jgi:hypothetical protein
MCRGVEALRHTILVTITAFGQNVTEIFKIVAAADGCLQAAMPGPIVVSVDDRIVV